MIKNVELMEMIRKNDENGYSKRNKKKICRKLYIIHGNIC